MRELRDLRICKSGCSSAWVWMLWLRGPRPLDGVRAALQAVLPPPQSTPQTLNEAVEFEPNSSFRAELLRLHILTAGGGVGGAT